MILDLEQTPEKRVREVVLEISKTVAEHEGPEGELGKMPYKDWRDLAISTIAKAIEQVEEIQRHKAELKRIDYMMVAGGIATVAFWSGVLVIGRIVRRLGLAPGIPF